MDDEELNTTSGGAAPCLCDALRLHSSAFGSGGEFAQDNAPASLRTYAASQKNQSQS